MGLTFTDDQLKRLKDANHFEEHDILALLARLEAAEKVLYLISGEKHPNVSLMDKFFDSWKAWRKACGK